MKPDAKGPVFDAEGKRLSQRHGNIISEAEGKTRSQIRKGPGFEAKCKRWSQTREGSQLEAEDKRSSARGGARREKVQSSMLRAIR